MLFCRWIFAVVVLGLTPVAGLAQNIASELCPRPAAGSVVPEPEDLRSQNGVLKAELRYRSFHDEHGQIRYCYQYKDGSQAPNLRVKPGDWLVLTLKNDLKPMANQHAASPMAMAMATPSTNRCGNGTMDAWSTNLHFHGLNIAPVCHQDDVLHTTIAPGDPPFEYRFQIPPDEPPGVYWYHPHVHGFSNAQVLGGASGALIVEGIERANPSLAGLTERVLII
jgi:FtsP/CotA-like multicopper oxidase with cupredoxin domain